MTDQLELVEKLMSKTGVGYADAKEALEKNDWDILEALVWLEKENKVHAENGSPYAQYSTQKSQKVPNEGAENFKQATKSFWEWCKSVIDKGNRNSLEMYKNGECRLSLPVTVFVLLLIFGFWIVLPLMIVALFFGFRFSFHGPELGKDSVNNALGKATDVADNIKNEFKNDVKPEGGVKQ